jgi:hypothetical protein
VTSAPVSESPDPAPPTDEVVAAEPAPPVTAPPETVPPPAVVPAGDDGGGLAPVPSDTKGAPAADDDGDAKVPGARKQGPSLGNALRADAAT